MHESSLVRDLIAKAEQVVDAAGGGHVDSVRISIGALSPIVGDHLADHFAMAIGGTSLDGARLVVEESADITDPAAQDVSLTGVDLRGS